MSGLPFTGFIVPSGGSGGGSGDVTGPGSSTSGNLAEFGDTSGALLADSGIVADNVVTNAGASTDNAIARYDSTTGKIVQGSDLTVSDVAGGVVTLATTAGNALTIDVTEPAAANGASVAGDPCIIQAGDAVASLDTAGAAAGGTLTISAGDAARNTSGNADGGDIILDTGAGIGTGTAGQVLLPSGSLSAPSVAFSGDEMLGFYRASAGRIDVVTGGASRTFFNSNGQTMAGTLNGGINRIQGFTQLVTASTAGSGAPNVINAAFTFSTFTNEGTTAENYHTLPTAVAGYQLTFVVQDADGIRITAAAGDTIRPIAGTAASATGGFIRCATQGAFITLLAINATEWISIGSAGTWTIDV